MRTLIVEDNPDGHRLMYVSVLVESATALGHEVHLALPQGVEDDALFDVHLRDLHCNPPPIRHALVGEASVAVVCQLSREIGSDLCVVPDGDVLATEVAWRGWKGSGALSALVMRDPLRPEVPADIPRQGVKLAMLVLASLRRVRLSVLSETPRSGRWMRWSNYAPDPIRLWTDPSTATALRDELNLGPGRWIGVLGRVTERKNLPLVAEAIMESGLTDLGLVIAGQIDPDLVPELEVVAGRLRTAGFGVRVVDRLFSNPEFDALVGLVDCVVAAHSNRGPSGISLRAVAAGTRAVVAHRKGRDDSSVWPMHVDLDVGSVAAALSTALARSAPVRSGDRSVHQFCEALLSTR
jgi:glycosyltransferase involved in cell wall biosynthesis